MSSTAVERVRRVPKSPSVTSYVSAGRGHTAGTHTETLPVRARASRRGPWCHPTPSSAPGPRRVSPTPAGPAPQMAMAVASARLVFRGLSLSRGPPRFRRGDWAAGLGGGPGGGASLRPPQRGTRAPRHGVSPAEPRVSGFRPPAVHLSLERWCLQLGGLLMGRRRVWIRATGFRNRPGPNLLS